MALDQVSAISMWLGTLILDVKSRARHLPATQQQRILRRLVRDGLERGIVMLPAQPTEVRFELEQLAMGLSEDSKRSVSA